MNVIELRPDMTDEESKQFAADFEKLVSGPTAYRGTIIINGKRHEYPRWKKWRDRIWNSLPVITLEMKLRDAMKRIAWWVR